MAKTPTGAVYFLKNIITESEADDIAKLQFVATDVPYLRLGSSSSAVEGQRVLVIGNPEGLDGTVSDGIISAFRSGRTMIQITAPVSPGSSGSPVLDESGNVIGMATLGSKEGQNLNFAIAVEKVSAVLTQQLPRKQSSGPALATATPTSAVDAKALLDNGNAFFDKKEYTKRSAPIPTRSASTQTTHLSTASEAVPTSVRPILAIRSAILTRRSGSIQSWLWRTTPVDSLMINSTG